MLNFSSYSKFSGKTCCFPDCREIFPELSPKDTVQNCISANASNRIVIYISIRMLSNNRKIINNGDCFWTYRMLRLFSWIDSS